LRRVSGITYQWHRGAAPRTQQTGARKQLTFKLTESKSIHVRIDASNVLNHPTPSIPLFTTGQFGVVTNKTDERALQGQLRLSF